MLFVIGYYDAVRVVKRTLMQQLPFLVKELYLPEEPCRGIYRLPIIRLISPNYLCCYFHGICMIMQSSTIQISPANMTTLFTFIDEPFKLFLLPDRDTQASGYDDMGDDAGFIELLFKNLNPCFAH